MSTLKTNDIQEATSGGRKVYLNRMFIALNGQGTIAIRNSGNVSSVIDHGVGDYTSNLSTSFTTPQHCLTTGLTEYAPSDPGAQNVHLRSSSGTGGSNPELSSSYIRVELGYAGGTNNDYAYLSWAAIV